jgi:hypothetical protein
MRALQLLVDGIDLRHHAEIALAVALGADHADRRLVDEIRIGAELAREADGLGRAAGMAVDEDDLGIRHGRQPLILGGHREAAGTGSDDDAGEDFLSRECGLDASPRGPACGS